MPISDRLGQPMTSVKQLWREAFGKQDDPKRNDSDFIAALMDNPEGVEARGTDYVGDL